MVSISIILYFMKIYVCIHSFSDLHSSMCTALCSLVPFKGFLHRQTSKPRQIENEKMCKIFREEYWAVHGVRERLK